MRPTLRGALSGGPPAGRCQPRWHQAAASAPDRCAPSQRPCGPAVPVLLPVTGPPDPLLHELTLVFNPTVRTHVTPRHSRPDPCCGWQGGRSRPGAVPMASVRPAAAVGLRQRLLQRGRKPLPGEPQPVPAGGVRASHSTGRPGACETASPPTPPTCSASHAGHCAEPPGLPWVLGQVVPLPRACGTARRGVGRPTLQSQDPFARSKTEDPKNFRVCRWYQCLSYYRLNREI